MTLNFSHNDVIYLDNNNKTKDLHIGKEITFGDKGVVYNLSNDPSKVIKVMIIGDDPDNEMTILEYEHEIHMNKLAFDVDLGVQLYDYGLFEMTHKKSKKVTIFCYFISKKLDKTIGDVLDKLISRVLDNKPVKIELLNTLMNDLYKRQISKCFLHGDLRHLGNIMLDKNTNINANTKGKLYFIDLSGSKLLSKESCLHDINKQWDTLKSNIKSDYELDKNETKIKAIIDSIFPTKLSPRRPRSRTPTPRRRSRSRTPTPRRRSRSRTPPPRRSSLSPPPRRTRSRSTSPRRTMSPKKK